MSELILTRAPMRISFLGGGSDLPFFPTATGEWGCVVSATIDRYVWVMAKRRRDCQIVAHYTIIERVSCLEELRNNYVREALKLVGWQGGIEIVSMGDLAIDRTGLGGSAAFLVALLVSLARLQGDTVDIDSALAERAFHLEAEVLGRLVGQQDHWAAVFGGCNQFQFASDWYDTTKHNVVFRKSIVLPAQIEDRFLLLPTGMDHAGDKILADVHHRDNRERNLKLYRVLAELAQKGAKYLDRGDPEKAFAMLGDSWIAKRGTSALMSTAGIDAMHDEVIAAGAKCGKICGSGGGGAMLFWCPDGKTEVLERLGGKYQEIGFQFTQRGVETLLEV